MKFKVFILLVITTSLFSCFDKRKEYKLQMLNEEVKYKIKRNDIGIRSLWVYLNDQRYSRRYLQEVKDKNIYKNVLYFQKIRPEILNYLSENGIETVDYEKYEDTLKKHCTNDSATYKHEIINLEKKLKLLNSYPKKKNNLEKLSWFITCLDLEWLYLNEGYYNGANYSESYQVFGSKKQFIFSDTSTLSIKEERKVIFLPSLLGKNEYARYDSIKFQVNKIDKKVPYQFENMDGLGILTFKPLEKGDYQIIAHYSMTHDKNTRKRFTTTYRTLRYTCKVK